jgi:hypothetical protein
MVPDQDFAMTVLANSVTASGLMLELIVKDWAIQLYGRDYVLRKDANGVPSSLRCDFIRDVAGRVRWFRYGGGVQRHET